MIGIPHRYLTEDFSGVGGRIKSEIEDFQVYEVPLYRPIDSGEHTFFEIEKADLSTLDAVEMIARNLGVPSQEIGYAGLKDRKAVTRQVLSVRLVSRERVLALEVPQIDVLWARRHVNKLRIGHLRGNRFKIRVRDIRDGAVDLVERVIDRIRRLGLPNYYGPQRFGSRGDAFLIGETLLHHDHRRAVRRILGHPSRTERNPQVVEARQRFMKGDLAGALEALPRNYRAERRLLTYLLRAPENYRGAARRIGESLKKIYYAAFQSYLFNRILDARLELGGGRPGKLFDGDLAFLHRNGAVFKVADAGAEQPRADAFEISPSGPLFGKMMAWPEGLAERIEIDTLEAQGIRPTLFHQLMPALHMKGGRRPFSIEVRDLRWRVEDRDLLLEFFLPKGCYATTFLREITKSDEPPDTYYSGRRDGDASSRAEPRERKAAL